MGLDAGSLRHRIAIDERMVTQCQKTGALINSWKFFQNLWAKVTPISGKEYIAGGQEGAKITVRVQVRYNPYLTNKMRLRYGNKVYNIEAILEDNQSGREWLTLMCSEGVTRGF